MRTTLSYPDRAYRTQHSVRSKDDGGLRLPKMAHGKSVVDFVLGTSGCPDNKVALVSLTWPCP